MVKAYELSPDDISRINGDVLTSFYEINALEGIDMVGLEEGESPGKGLRLRVHLSKDDKNLKLTLLRDGSIRFEMDLHHPGIRYDPNESLITGKVSTEELLKLLDLFW